VAGGHGGGATGFGDALVLLSVLMVATVTVAQGRLLEGQNPAAVTAVQFIGAALAALPVAICAGGLPHAPAPGGAGALAVVAVVGLAVLGTLVPFTLFAYGQHAVSAEVAGAFLNLEPLVGSLAGVVFFADPAGPRLAIGVGLTGEFRPEEIGRAAQIEETKSRVQDAEEKLREFVETHGMKEKIGPRAFAEFERELHQRFMEAERDVIADEMLRYFSVQNFLYEEAALLDERRFDEWLELCAPDIRYWMPAQTNRDRRERGLTVGGPKDLPMFEETWEHLHQRVRRLATGHAGQCRQHVPDVPLRDTGDDRDGGNRLAPLRHLT